MTKNIIKALIIQFEKDWNFEIKDITDEFGFEELPIEDTLCREGENGFYISTIKSSSFITFKFYNNLNYLLFFDESKLKKETDSISLDELEDPMIMALLACFSKFDSLNSSLALSIFKYFFKKGKYDILNELYESLYENEKLSLSLNYFTLFFGYFIKQFDFKDKIKDVHKPKKFKEILNLLNLIDIFDKFPDRFRFAFLSTVFHFPELEGKREALDEKKETINGKKLYREKHEESENYEKQMFDALFNILETNTKPEIWSESISILKMFLPNIYWNYFIDHYLFQSPHFVLNTELSSKIIREYNLINKLIEEKPILFDTIFEKVIGDEGILNKIDINIFQNYFNSFSSLPFSKLLGLENEPWEINNRLKYFDILTCLLKLSQMTIDDFLDPFNEENNKSLLTFSQTINNKEKFVQYIDTKQNQVVIKDQFSLIFRNIFGPVTSNFKENNVYIIKDFIDNTVLDDCIFKQMSALGKNETFEKLVKECYMKKEDWETLQRRVVIIDQYFENHKDNFPNEISYEKMVEG